MTGVTKARLAPVEDNGEPGTWIDVQFNPNTMSLSMTNSIDGNSNNGRQARKYTGTSSANLSLDLEFDTADAGEDVREKTKEIAQFVLPAGQGAKKAPPRVRFEWGTFALQGVMSSLSEELSFFGADGTPLRAKLSVQISEQDPAYVANDSGTGADPGRDSPASGESDPENPAEPGANSNAPADKAAEALDGETPADFAARNGLAPEAWRALGSALDALEDGVSLPVGLSIPFPSSLSLGAGIGISAGFQAGLDLSAEASLGLEVGNASGSRKDRDQGMALGAAGGVTAAAEQQMVDEASASAGDARSRFGTSPASSPSPPSTAATSSGGSSERNPVAISSGPSLNRSRQAAPAPTPPVADRRATSFGRGVPLRERIGDTEIDGCGWVVIGQPDAVAVSASTGRSRHAPWEILPSDAGRRRADSAQHARTPDCGCHRCDPRSRSQYRGGH